MVNKVDTGTEDGVGTAPLARQILVALHLAATGEGAAKCLARLKAPVDLDQLDHSRHPAHSPPLDLRNTDLRLMYSIPQRHL